MSKTEGKLSQNLNIKKRLDFKKHIFYLYNKMDHLIKDFKSELI